MKAKQKVKFKSDYNGYFNKYKNKTFTVKVAYNSSIGERLILKELKEPHILEAKVLEIYNDAKKK